MADNRRNRYSSDHDDTETSVSSRRTRRSSQNTNTRRSDSRFDTQAVTRSLEEQADSQARRTGYNSENSRSETGRTSTRRSSQRQTARIAPVNEQTYEEQRRERQRLRRERKEYERWRFAHRIVRILIVIVLILDVIIFRFGIFKGGFLPVWNMLTSGGTTTASTETTVSSGIDLEISEQLLTVNEYSRPGTELTAVNGIVVHYIGNPGTDAQANRDYFESLKDGSSEVYSSCNYIIGLDGTIIQCVPDNEVAYASGERNSDTISIECCHPDETGAFTEETYNSLVLLTAKLCSEYSLTTDQILRHYDVNGKPCPLYFVNDADAWSSFLSSVAAQLQS